MPIRLASAEGVHVVAGGRRLVSFAGCDSLGLARRPEVVEAAKAALDACGVGAAASRTTTGTWTAHVALERRLARWMDSEDAVVLPSGWVTGAALAAALAPDADVVLLDGGAHPALREAAKLTGLPIEVFPHFDAGSIRGFGKARPLVMTDAVDLVEGRLAPLSALARLVERTKGRLLVDDAHGVGVLGPRGRGTCDAAGVGGPRVHVAGSLSKALGAHGGFVTGTRALCDAVRSASPAYSGGTPIPPAVAAAAAKAVELASDGDELRRKLLVNVRRLRKRFAAVGLPAPRPGLPWFAVHGRPATDLRAIASTLRRAGFLVPHLRYHGAPREGFLKIALSAAHERSQVDAMADQLARAWTSPRVPR